MNDEEQARMFAAAVLPVLVDPVHGRGPHSLETACLSAAVWGYEMVRAMKKQAEYEKARQEVMESRPSQRDSEVVVQTAKDVVLSAFPDAYCAPFPNMGYGVWESRFPGQSFRLGEGLTEGGAWESARREVLRLARPSSADAGTPCP